MLNEKELVLIDDFLDNCISHCHYNEGELNIDDETIDVLYVVSSNLSFHSLIQRTIVILDDILYAVIVVILFFLGFLLAYNISIIPNWLFVIFKLKRIPYPAGCPQIRIRTPHRRFSAGSVIYDLNTRSSH